jgi:hypothetical protein
MIKWFKILYDAIIEARMKRAEYIADYYKKHGHLPVIY